MFHDVPEPWFLLVLLCLPYHLGQLLITMTGLMAVASRGGSAYRLGLTGCLRDGSGLALEVVKVQLLAVDLAIELGGSNPLKGARGFDHEWFCRATGSCLSSAREEQGLCRVHLAGEAVREGLGTVPVDLTTGPDLALADGNRTLGAVFVAQVAMRPNALALEIGEVCPVTARRSRVMRLAKPGKTMTV